MDRRAANDLQRVLVAATAMRTPAAPLTCMPSPATPRRAEIRAADASIVLDFGIDTGNDARL
jgi:hypothetical protein